MNIEIFYTFLAWMIIILVLAYKLDIVGLIIGVTLPPVIGYFIIPIETATTLVSFTYLEVFIIIILQLNLFIFGKKYPYNIKSINPEDIKLSDENLKLFHQSNSSLVKLNNELSKVKALDLTTRQDGLFSEKSKAGKEANAKWNKLENSISSEERVKNDSVQKQTSYRWKWVNIQLFKNYQSALVVSLLLSFFVLLLIDSFYKPSFLTFIQQFLLENSQIKWLSNFDATYISSLELSGTVTLFLYPLMVALFHMLNNPYGKGYDDLKQLFYDLNHGVYSIDNNLIEEENSVSF